MVTQNDIAKKLNISRTTVARALSGRSVSEETRKLVCEQARAMGYVHNSAASSLALKNNRKVYAFIIATIDEGYGRQMLEGIKEVANIWQGYHFEIEVIFTDITLGRNQCQTQMEQFYHVIHNDRVDGIIFSALSQQNMDAVTEVCRKRQIPLMTLDLIYRNEELCHIGPDYIELGKYSASYIASLMQKRGKILTLSYDEGYELANYRMQGFHQHLSNYPNIICKSVDIKINTEECYHHTLSEHLDDLQPIAIYSPYHVDYIGNYLKKHGLDGKIILICNGVNERVEEFLSDGTITGIVSARPYFLGAVAANNFFKLFFRQFEMLTGKIDVSCDIYIKETYKRYDRIY